MAREAEEKGTRHALLSVFHKDGIVEFGAFIVCPERGFYAH